MTDIGTLRRLLNGPFKPYADLKVKKDDTFTVDIFLLLPDNVYSDSEFVNIGIVCIGRYELVGNGGTVAKTIEKSLDDIIASFRWVNILDKIHDRRLPSNLVFVFEGMQYFVTDKNKNAKYGVEARDPKYMFATRVKKVNIPGKGQGMLMFSEEPWAISDMGIGIKFKEVGEDSEWWFPAVAWNNVDGVRNTVIVVSTSVPDAFITGADGNDTVMVPDSFESDLGVLPIRTPVYVKKQDGEQRNYVCGFAWYIMKAQTDSRQDRELGGGDVWMTLETPDGSIITHRYYNPNVTCRVDYWKGKALRVSYFQGGHPYMLPDADTHKLELGFQFNDGNRITGIYSSRPDLVNRPLKLTAFDKTLNPTLYSSDIYDIIIIKQDLNGLVKEFKAFNADGSEADVPAYKFAIIGDHLGNPDGIKRMRTMDLSSAVDFHNELARVAKSAPKDTVIDDLILNDRDGSLHTGSQIEGDKILRKITVTKFDKNLTPYQVEIETDVDTTFILNSTPEMLSWRFTVPDEPRLKEIDEDYKNVAKQMSQKAQTRGEDIAKWRKGKIYEALNDDVKNLVGLVANDGISGDTMINTEELKRNGRLEIKGDAS